MNILVTASIGLYVDENDIFYLQVISSESEEHYLIPIDSRDASRICSKEDLEISLLSK